ncbi:MAG: hypothetical protein RLN86_14295 [Cyclobacteriaceae bacterium]
MEFLKLLAYTLILNILRYFPGSWIETYTIFESMHRPMAEFPDCFGFTDADFPSSLLYNFMMWLSVTSIFHVGHASIKGSLLFKSLVFYGLCCMFFISLAAIYMNHFTAGIRVFYMYSILDGLILFTFLGFVNSILYPKFFPFKI